MAIRKPERNLVMILREIARKERKERDVKPLRELMDSMGIEVTDIAMLFR